MKIGRTESCPCGSGKAFKKCCRNKPNNLSSKKAFANINEANPFFNKYCTVELLKSFAGLSLLHENHGKNIRFEELTLATLQNYNNIKNNISANELRDFLDVEYPSNYLEDLPVNLFTDLITFYGGDYLIFPGITENDCSILSNLLAAIFHWPESKIPDQFVINCKHTVTFILAISNVIALKLGYQRYQEGDQKEDKIEVPSDLYLNQLKNAVVFSSEEIDKLSTDKGFAKEAINEFLIDKNSPELFSNHIEESPIILKPILSVDGDLIVISPTTLSYALIDYIWCEAERYGCMQEVNDAYHNVVWNNLQLQLGNMKFSFKVLEGIKLNEREGLYTFDDNKIAYVQYLYDDGLNYKNKNNTIGQLDTKISKEHKNEVILKILSHPEFINFEIFDFIIPSSIGRGFSCSIMKVENATTIAIPIFDLEILWNLKETNAIDLWKFAIAREEQLEGVDVVSFSFLDQYEFYKSHHDSFYLSDETKYSLFSIVPGFSADKIKDAKLKTDKHSVLKYIKGRFAYVQVEKKDIYAPIYVDLMGLLNSELEFYVEGFYQPIWVCPLAEIKNVKGDLRHMYWQINDALAYWLWQIQDEVKNDLKLIGGNPLTFTFELNQIGKFETIEREFTRDPNLLDKFTTDATKTTINILIPAEIIPYLYGSDNQGEIDLVRNILIGINKLLKTNNQPIISEVRITEILECKAPLGMKKKFFILDSNDNLLLDQRNLDDYRFVQEYDTSVTLNSIVPSLGNLCPPTGEVITQKEKDDLSFKIVQNALFPLLLSAISQYNSTELLKRLIAQNESLIRKREELKVHTPTRIACFVSVEQHQNDLKADLKEVNKTTIAIRCLIEHIAAEPSKGVKMISTTAIDELVAIMDQIISWGSISDQIHYNLFDIKMSVLPSGRIGTEKTLMKEIFDPYYESKINENVSDLIQTFNQVFPQNENEIGKDVPKKLDKAFLIDFGISFTRICDFIEGLAKIGFLQSTSFASFPLDNLKDEVNKYVNFFDENEFQKAIDYLSLYNRGKVVKLPKGYDFIDIMPWRFNRMLSYLRKPIILVDAEIIGQSKVVYWGARQVLLSRMYIADQCLSDRLRVFENSEIKKVLGSFAQERGDNLVKKVIESINPLGLIIDNDVFIGPNFSLKNSINIGDIDVLIIDKKRKLLFSIECKSMSPSRNIKEMIEEVAKLFGSNSEKGWIDKHVRRHEWLESNRMQISNKYDLDISDYLIKSYFVTNEDMLTPYLRKQTLKIPFITSYELEKKGYDLLIK